MCRLGWKWFGTFCRNKRPVLSNTEGTLAAGPKAGPSRYQGQTLKHEVEENGEADKTLDNRFEPVRNLMYQTDMAGRD